jgi:hypothetical protein
MRLPKDPPEMRLPSEPSLIFMALADSRSPSIAIQGAEGWLRVTSPQAWTSTPSRCGRLSTAQRRYVCRLRAAAERTLMMA